MKETKLSIIVFSVIAILLTEASYAKQIDLFILAGQSNMQGWRSDAANYPADPHNLDQKIPFYFEAINYSSTEEHWQTLRPQAGHFKSGHFGPEVSFARALLNTKMNPAIFKYSSGGTSIKTDWKAPGQKGLYDKMVKNLNLAILELELQGHTVTPRALIWIQGETDANDNQLSTEYYWHLKKLLHHLRTNVLQTPKLPVILSVDEQHPRVQLNPQVVDAQVKLANEDKTIKFMSMKGLEKFDVTHLTAKGTIKQGLRIYSTYRSSLWKK